MEKIVTLVSLKCGVASLLSFPASACIADLVSHTCGYPLIMGAFKKDSSERFIVILFD